MCGKSGFGRDDHEFGIALGPEGPELHRWAGKGASGGKNSPRMLLAVTREAGTTVYEWALPWSELAPFRAEVGAVFGMSFVVPDSDDGAAAAYWLRLSQGIANGKNPSYYPNFVLLE